MTCGVANAPRELGIGVGHRVSGRLGVERVPYSGSVRHRDAAPRRKAYARTQHVVRRSCAPRRGPAAAPRQRLAAALGPRETWSIMPARNRQRTLSTWMAATATLAVVASLSLVGVDSASAVAAGAVPAGSSPLSGSVPNWATPQAVRGATPAGTGVSVDVYLTSRDPGGLSAYATEVSDPTSSSTTTTSPPLSRTRASAPAPPSSRPSRPG